jgi:entericidin B
VILSVSQQTNNLKEQKMTAKTYYPKIKSILTVLLLSSALGACATIDGAGKDLEKAGEAIQNAVKG